MRILIEGILWTGAIRTVGAGKEFDKLESAVTNANNAHEASVYLVYESDPSFPGPMSANYDCYVLGVGDEGYNNIQVNAISVNAAGGKTYFENIRMASNCFAGTYSDCILKSNKCTFINSNANNYVLYGYYHDIDYTHTPFTTFTNTYLQGNAKIIMECLLDRISIIKCSYDTPWNPVNCSGTLAIDDKAVEPTDNYGPDYGTSGLLIEIIEPYTHNLALDDSFILSEETSIVPKPLILDRLSIEPYTPTMIVGQSQQTGAIGYYNFNTTVNLTQLVTWVSSNPTVATIDSNGLIAAVSTGITFIRATYGSISTYIMLKVEQAVTVSTITGSYTYQQIPLTPDPNQTFSCTLLIDGKNIPIDFQLRWNAQANYWVMTLINSASRTYYVDSIPLIAGVQPTINILQPYSYLKIGSCYIVNISGIASDYPTDDNLGTDYIMLWGDTENV